MFFFFKQKTSYEMRFSDWSSDVCSSDLSAWYAPVGLDRSAELRAFAGRPAVCVRQRPPGSRSTARVCAETRVRRRHALDTSSGLCRLSRTRSGIGRRQRRSEEHTSELQSLMRISYAVFCLKKKKK